MQGTQEKKNPRDGASVLSIIFLWWIQDVLRLGNKRPLTDKDLLPLLEDYKAKVLIEKAEKHWMNELKRSQLKNRKPRLWKALIRLIPWRSRLAIIVLKSLWSLSFVFLPLCLWLVLKTLNDRSSMDMKLASVYVALLGVTSVVKAVSTQHCDYLTELWGLKLKVAVIGLIYKKVTGDGYRIYIGKFSYYYQELKRLIWLNQANRNLQSLMTDKSIRRRQCVDNC